MEYVTAISINVFKKTNNFGQVKISQIIGRQKLRESGEGIIMRQFQVFHTVYLIMRTIGLHTPSTCVAFLYRTAHTLLYQLDK